MPKKSLYILRHGKSSWAVPEQADFDRPLNKRGKRAARMIGRQAAAHGWAPDAILCSPSARTAATLALFTKGWTSAGGGGLPDATLKRAFYLGKAEVWLRHVRALEPEGDSALLIGHNPGLHDLALALAGSGDKGLLKRLAGKFPTCALAVIEFEGSGWQAVTPGAGHLTELIFPKDLEKKAER